MVIIELQDGRFTKSYLLDRARVAIYAKLNMFLKCLLINEAAEPAILKWKRKENPHLQYVTYAMYKSAPLIIHSRLSINTCPAVRICLQGECRIFLFLIKNGMYHLCC